jgi:hypothetical protein
MESSNRAFDGLATPENSFGDALGTDLQSSARNQRTHLPKSIRAVAIEQGVTADDRELLGERLSDEQAVEWVAVMPRKVHLKIGVFHGDRQRRGLLSNDHGSDEAFNHEAHPVFSVLDSRSAPFMKTLLPEKRTLLVSLGAALPYKTYFSKATHDRIAAMSKGIVEVTIITDGSHNIIYHLLHVVGVVLSIDSPL